MRDLFEQFNEMGEADRRFKRRSTLIQVVIVLVTVLILGSLAVHLFQYFTQNPNEFRRSTWWW